MKYFTDIFHKYFKISSTVQS